MMTDHNVRSVLARKFQRKIGREVPDVPTTELMGDDVRLAHAKVLFEEALEAVEALGCHVYTNGKVGPLTGDSTTVERDPFADGGIDLLHLAHELTDLAFINETTAAMYGLPTQRLFVEMYRSNITKILDGHVLRHQSKNPHPQYSPPDLESVLRGSVLDNEDG